MLPGQLSQKTGQRDNKDGIVASKSKHQNTLHPMKTVPVYKEKILMFLTKEIFIQIYLQKQKSP